MIFAENYTYHDINEGSHLLTDNNYIEKAVLEPNSDFKTPEVRSSRGGFSSFSRSVKDAFNGFRGRVGGRKQPNVASPTEKPSILEENKSSASSATGSTLWAKARERLPDLHLMESERNESKKKDFGSSIQEHMELKLWMCILVIVSHLAIGTISYSCVFENWSVVDSLYFSMVTFTTVGYGDMYPSTGAGQIFTAIYSLVGISFWGLAIAEIGGRFVAYEMRLMLRADKILNDIVADSVFSLLTLNFTEEEKQNKNSNVRSTDSLKEANTKAIFTWIKTYIFVFISLLIGSLFIGYVEGWGWKKSIYFCTMTATTVGKLHF
jgi:hypothetical protein